MKRDEAYQRATTAVSDRRSIIARDTGNLVRLPNAQDWQQPSLHDVLAALEALGVLRFDAPETVIRATRFGQAKEVCWVERLGSSGGGLYVDIEAILTALRASGWTCTKGPKGKRKPDSLELQQMALDLEEAGYTVKAPGTVTKTVLTRAYVARIVADPKHIDWLCEKLGVTA